MPISVRGLIPVRFGRKNAKLGGVYAPNLASVYERYEKNSVSVPLHFHHVKLPEIIRLIYEVLLKIWQN
jgi:hypothetical protein